MDDRPLGMVLSPDGARLAVVTGSNFAPRALHILDAAEGRMLDCVAIGDSFVGVAFSPDGRTLYVGGGASNEVKVLREQTGGKFQQQDAFPIEGSAPSGLSLSPDGAILYVALNLKHAIAIIHLERRQATEVPVGMHPYTTVSMPSGRKVYGRTGRAGGPGQGTRPMRRTTLWSIPARAFPRRGQCPSSTRKSKS